MADAMTGRDYYIQHGYDELPEAVREEMRRVFDTGVNNSGVWVRFKEVENLAGVMAYQYTHRPTATNADRIRAMTDGELAEFIGGIYTLERDAWGDYDPCVVIDQGVKIRDRDDMLDWLQSPAGEEQNGS